ncbi:MAG: hypothetical protein L6R40_006732 [Gallowayella cf. fulva]|nr:MAG: hypothetical protein L6R40_006732 [Xanthomendoza cf. fulva]
MRTSHFNLQHPQCLSSLLLTPILSTTSSFANALALSHPTTTAPATDASPDQIKDITKREPLNTSHLPILPILPWKYKIQAGDGITIDLSFSLRRQPLTPSSLHALFLAAYATLSKEARETPHYSRQAIYPLQNDQQIFYEGSRAGIDGLIIRVQNISAYRKFTWGELQDVVRALKYFRVDGEKAWACTFKFRDRNGVIGKGRVGVWKPEVAPGGVVNDGTSYITTSLYDKLCSTANMLGQQYRKYTSTSGGFRSQVVASFTTPTGGGGGGWMYGSLFFLG